MFRDLIYLFKNCEELRGSVVNWQFHMCIQLPVTRTHKHMCTYTHAQCVCVFMCCVAVWNDMLQNVLVLSFVSHLRKKLWKHMQCCKQHLVIQEWC